MLQQYTFSLPTTVRFGVGVVKEAGECAKSLGATHAMIVADQGVIRAGLTRDVETSLQSAGVPYIYYDKIVPNPRDYHCAEGYETAKIAWWPWAAAALWTPPRQSAPC